MLEGGEERGGSRRLRVNGRCTQALMCGLWFQETETTSGDKSWARAIPSEAQGRPKLATPLSKGQE